MGEAERLRREGTRLMAKGQAMLDRAANIEADVALGGRPPPGPTGATTGVAATAREMGDEGWFTAQALAERCGIDQRKAASCLSRLAARYELESRKQPGYPAEYRSET